MTLRGFTLSKAPKQKGVTHMTITTGGGVVLPTMATIAFTGQVTNNGTTPIFAAALLRPLIAGSVIADTSAAGHRQTQGAVVSVAPGATATVTASVPIFATDPVGPITAQVELWAGFAAGTIAKTTFGATSAVLGTVDPPTGPGLAFITDPLLYSGEHQATFNEIAVPGVINSSFGQPITAANAKTSVNIDDNAWDAWRQGTKYNMTGALVTNPPNPLDGSGQPESNGNYNGIVHAATPDGIASSADGWPAAKYAVGGDGGAGVWVNKLDYEGVLSSRLRMPLSCGPGTPIVVSFWASRHNNAAFWWEAMINPTAQGVLGADQGALPGPGSISSALFQMAGPGPGGPPTPGDSCNIIFMASTDVPQIGVNNCRATVDMARNGVRENADRWPGYEYAGLEQALHKGDLEPFTLKWFWPDAMYPSGHAEIWSGMFDQPPLTPLAGVPGMPGWVLGGNLDLPRGCVWPEVYFTLLAVAYQATHHPQTLYAGRSSEIYFRGRGIDMGPAIGHHTNYIGFPFGYDLRDTRHYGPPVLGQNQPNTHLYDRFNDVLVDGSVPSVNIPANDPCPDLTHAVRATLVYDTRNRVTGSGSAMVQINGGLPIALLTEASSRGSQLDGEHWSPRSIIVPMTSLVVGQKPTLTFITSGSIQIDRPQIEFVHSA